MSKGVIGCVCMRSLCVCVTLIICVSVSTYNACVGVEHFQSRRLSVCGWGVFVW